MNKSASKKICWKSISELVCLIHPLCKIRSFYFISESILSDKQPDRRKRTHISPEQDRHIFPQRSLSFVHSQQRIYFKDIGHFYAFMFSINFLVLYLLPGAICMLMSGTQKGYKSLIYTHQRG